MAVRPKHRSTVMPPSPKPKAVVTGLLYAVDSSYVQSCVDRMISRVVQIRKLLAASRISGKEEIERHLIAIESEVKYVTAECDLCPATSPIYDVLESWLDVESVVDAAVDYVNATDREPSVATEYDYDRLRRAVGEYARK